MVKKLIFTFVVLALIVSLWMHLRGSGGIQLSQMVGKFETLNRGNLKIPITADGTIEPKDRVVLKSEAGGTVEKIFFEVGDMVRRGDLLIKLNPQDEQRLVDIANKALKQAEINLDRAKNTLYQSEHIDVRHADSFLDSAVADLGYWKWRYEWYGDLKDKGLTDPDEYRQIELNFRKFKALKAQRDAELERAKKNIERSTFDVQSAELAVEKSKDDLADAKERLKETEIVAPSDGMLSRLIVKEGEVIVSGSRSLTVGSALATLADVSEFYVRALVDEADIGRVREIAPSYARPGNRPAESNPGAGTDGDNPNEEDTPVKVTVDAFPDEEFEGVIELIEPEPEEGRQVIISYVVRIRLTSENTAKLFLGTQANVEFVSESVEDVVLVPNEAVRYVAGERGVYLRVDSEKVPGKKVPEFKPFRAGLDNGLYTQVIAGLQEGDVVYTKLPRDRMGQ